VLRGESLFGQMCAVDEAFNGRPGKPTGAIIPNLEAKFVRNLPTTNGMTLRCGQKKYVCPTPGMFPLPWLYASFIDALTKVPIVHPDQRPDERDQQERPAEASYTQIGSDPLDLTELVEFHAETRVQRGGASLSHVNMKFRASPQGPVQEFHGVSSVGQFQAVIQAFQLTGERKLAVSTRIQQIEFQRIAAGRGKQVTINMQQSQGEKESQPFTLRGDHDFVLQFALQLFRRNYVAEPQVEVEAREARVAGTKRKK